MSFMENERKVLQGMSFLITVKIKFLQTAVCSVSVRHSK